MVLPIAKLPAKVLRNKVVDLNFPLKKDLLRLTKNMLDTCIAANGVGLAAPQVSQSLNMAVIYLDQGRLEDRNIPAFYIVNPQITATSQETEIMEEGCLSLPEVFGEVRRPKKITMEAYNLDGEKFTITDDGFLARVLQHEIDHLNNVLIIDKFEKVTTGEEFLPQFAE
jgi:peptide deformylase